MPAHQDDYDLQPDLTGRFNKIRMSPQTEVMAMNVSPLFLAYLQNKIADYAEAAVESKLPYHADPTQQMAAILEHERLKNFISAYAELMAELTQASAHNQPSNLE
jgi:hypothetical protein